MEFSESSMPINTCSDSTKWNCTIIEESNDKNANVSISSPSPSYSHDTSIAPSSITTTSTTTTTTTNIPVTQPTLPPATTTTTTTTTTTMTTERTRLSARDPSRSDQANVSNSMSLSTGDQKSEGGNTYSNKNILKRSKIVASLLVCWTFFLIWGG